MLVESGLTPALGYLIGGFLDVLSLFVGRIQEAMGWGMGIGLISGCARIAYLDTFRRPQ